MAGLGGPGLGGTGKKKSSIGSQVGKALGGHMKRLGREGKLGSKYAKHFQNDKGNLTYSGFKTMLSSFFGGDAYANAMGQATGKSVLNQNLNPNFVKRMEKLNLDVTNPQPGLKWTINNQKAIDNIQNETVRNWLNKNIPKAVKDWKINHQMHYTPKIKPGDPRWTAQGTGSAKLDKNTEKYLEWMARANPQGHTISDYKKLYKSQIDSGVDLYQAMRFNPAETGNYFALLDDTAEANNEKLKVKAEDKNQDEQDQVIHNNNNMTSTYFDPLERDLTDNQKKLDQIYKDNLGRSASFGTKGGADYWLDTHAKGDTVDWDNISRMIGGSDEGTKFAASKTSDNLAGTPLVGGIDASKSISSQAGPGTWASHFLPGGRFANQDAAGAATAIAKDINFGTPKAVGFEDGINKTPNYFNTGVTDQTQADTTGTTISKEISDGWWNQFADADAFKDFLNGDQTQTQSGGMDDFMKFMMLMSVMGGGRGGGGGYGGSQYGYGGMNPGGVQSAYNPWENMTKGWDFMKNAFGSGSGETGSGATTGTVNAT